MPHSPRARQSSAALRSPIHTRSRTLKPPPPLTLPRAATRLCPSSLRRSAAARPSSPNAATATRCPRSPSVGIAQTLGPPIPFRSASSPLSPRAPPHPASSAAALPATAVMAAAGARARWRTGLEDGGSRQAQHGRTEGEAAADRGEEPPPRNHRRGPRSTNVPEICPATTAAPRPLGFHLLPLPHAATHTCLRSESLSTLLLPDGSHNHPGPPRSAPHRRPARQRFDPRCRCAHLPLTSIHAVAAIPRPPAPAAPPAPPRPRLPTRRSVLGCRPGRARRGPPWLSSTGQALLRRQAPSHGGVSGVADQDLRPGVVLWQGQLRGRDLRGQW